MLPCCAVGVIDVWVGTYNWLFDTSLLVPTSVTGSYFQGVVGTSRPVEVESPAYLVRHQSPVL